jgi:hypothetical protein
MALVLYLPNMHQYYSTHRVIDGKWEVTIWIYEEEDFSNRQHDCPDLRKLIADNYSVQPLDLAILILNNVLHCERVQINDLSGNGVYVEK